MKGDSIWGVKEKATRLGKGTEISDETTLNLRLDVKISIETKIGRPLVQLVDQ